MCSVGKRRNHCDLRRSGCEVHLFAQGESVGSALLFHDPQDNGAVQVRAGSFMASHPLVNRGQNVAIGLTGLPDVPAKRTGATARWKSHWPSSAAVVAHTSRSQLSSSHRPIATRLTA